MWCWKLNSSRIFCARFFVLIDFSLRHTRSNLIKITNDLVKILRNRAIPSSRFSPLSSAYDSENDSKGRELPLPPSFFVVSFFSFFFIRHPFKIPPPFFSSFASKKKQYPADQLDKVSRISEWIISRQRIPFAPRELVK